MDINLNNYEAYFLDYHEGSLSPALVQDLMTFIAAYPELKEEFESYAPLTLKDTEKIKYEGKELLKRSKASIDYSNFAHIAIEYVEGTLPAGIQKELKTFISQNPTYKKELELYAKTKLTPDTSIIFDDKPSLKRRTKKPVPFYYWSAAASVALIIGAYFIFNKTTIPGKTTVMQTPVKDSVIVANNSSKHIDTTKVLPKSVSHSFLINPVKNTPVVSINKHPQKQQEVKNIIPDNSKKDSSSLIANNGINILHAEPVKKEITIPAHSGNDSLASNNSANDDTWHVIKRPKESKKRKFLIKLATLTCKGLHKITGQHIELEKHYGSDTTSVIAYQLDLGNRKIEFPVKE